jgi:lysosomal Pro-X carboxypeptidase
VICLRLHIYVTISDYHDQHRFYGEPLPFGNNSAEVLGYLTSTQALADFAILITSLKQNLSAEMAPVVVFGGSYGGSKSF